MWNIRSQSLAQPSLIEVEFAPHHSTMPMHLTFNLRRVVGGGRKEDKSWRTGRSTAGRQPISLSSHPGIAQALIQREIGFNVNLRGASDYEDCRKGAEEYGKEFLKKHDQI